MSTEIAALISKLGIKIPEKLDPQNQVLIIESQQDMRMICVHHLQKRQFHNILQASNGLEAIEMLEELAKEGKHCNLIVCSQELPSMTGIDFVEEVQARLSLNRCAITMSLANVTKEKILRCVESGIDEIIAKPFTLGDIIPKLTSSFKKFNNPKNPELVYEFAKAKVRDGDLDLAEKIYKVLCSASGTSARPYVGLANIALKRDQPAQGFQYLQTAEEKNPNYVHTFVLRGELYSKQQKWEEALECYQKSIELSPLNPIRYIQVATILLELKRYQDIIETLNIAKKHEIDFPHLYHYYSQAYFFLKEYKHAVRYVGMALKHDPTNLDYLNQQAIAMKSQGDHEGAMKSYNLIIKQDPDNVKSLYNKAILLKDIGRVPDAIKVLERLAEKKPDFQQGIKKLEELRELGKAS